MLDERIKRSTKPAPTTGVRSTAAAATTVSAELILIDRNISDR